MTGRTLCQACSDRFNGTATALIAGAGGDVGTTAGNAISTTGWLGRVRRARNG